LAGYDGLPYRGIYSASKGALEFGGQKQLTNGIKALELHYKNLGPGDFATNL